MSLLLRLSPRVLMYPALFSRFDGRWWMVLPETNAAGREGGKRGRKTYSGKGATMTGIKRRTMKSRLIFTILHFPGDVIHRSSNLV